MSPKEEMGVGVMEAAEPEFQVVREREGEGGTEKKEGGRSRRYKRCSVFSGKRVRDVGKGGGVTV